MAKDKDGRPILTADDWKTGKDRKKEPPGSPEPLPTGCCSIPLLLMIGVLPLWLIWPAPEKKGGMAGVWKTDKEPTPAGTSPVLQTRAPSLRGVYQIVLHEDGEMTRVSPANEHRGRHQEKGIYYVKEGSSFSGPKLIFHVKETKTRKFLPPTWHQRPSHIFPEPIKGLNEGTFPAYTVDFIILPDGFIKEKLHPDRIYKGTNQVTPSDESP